VRFARRLLAGALAGAAVLASATAGIAASDERSGARAAGEDSPWPRTSSLPANVRAVRSVVADLEARVEQMQLSAGRYADWESCIRGVPVSEYGDPDRRFGYMYDERDGTGRGFMPALAVDRRSRPRREDYLFLDLARQAGCRSVASLPDGTATSASVRSPGAVTAGGSLRRTMSRLERKVRRLKRAERRLLEASERFDEWASCASWVPVTEYGDPDGRFGYLFDRGKLTAPGYRPALAVDRSDWDDPDYMFLAFVSGDRPGRGCQDEPGEGVD
jgi:hypothetical protein